MAEARAAKNAEVASNTGASSSKGGFKMLLILIVLLGGVAAGVGYSGVINKTLYPEEKVDENMSDVSKAAFVPFTRMVVPLGDQASAKHLAAQFVVETTLEHRERIEKLKPRLLDMLNTYLRAVDEKELTEPSRFRQLQAQMLRRAKLIAGDAAVRNLLVQEFLLQ